MFCQLSEEMQFFNDFIDKDKTLIERLKVIETPFPKITYKDALDELKEVEDMFEYKIHWGMDIQTEHEKYLTEKYGPVFIYGLSKK